MIKLLLVEDDESLAYIEKTGLEDIIGGYEVITAKNIGYRHACNEWFRNGGTYPRN